MTADKRPPSPPREPGCKCGPWKWVMDHWTFTVNKHCPIHGEG